jgi:hypothetical protein
MAEHERQILARIDALIAEARTLYQERGIPDEEIDQETLQRYAFDHLSEAERAAFGLPTPAELEEILAFAQFSNAVDDYYKERGESPPPPDEDDPERAALIVEAKRYLREQKKAEAFWGSEGEDHEP